MKLSHQGSKHGVNIELLEWGRSPTILVSSQGGGGKHNFPHLLAMEAVREARQPTTTDSADRKPDYVLGVHLTGSKLESGIEMGSIAAVIGSAGKKTDPALRLMNAPEPTSTCTRHEKFVTRFGPSDSGQGDMADLVSSSALE